MKIEIDNKKRLINYLREQYKNVCSEEQIQRHIEEYVGFVFADQMVSWIISDGNNQGKILDIGSGYGSFVLRALQNNIDAVGIELSDFEVNFARDRLRKLMPKEDPFKIYINGDACNLPFPAGTFSIVTLWNVLEHIEDKNMLIKEVKRVLKPNGHVYLICPNYASFRKEAHYHVQWYPFLPRKLVLTYLRKNKKNPVFFENYIYPGTNWGIILLFAKNKFKIVETEAYQNKINNPDSIKNKKVRKGVIILKGLRVVFILHIALFIVVLIKRIRLLNPFKHSVVLHMQKKGEV